MRLSEVVTVAGILSGIKINKISDKEVKTTLINDYLHLRKFAKGADSDAEELRKKFRQDWAEELEEVSKLRRDGKPVVGHKEYLDAELDANKGIQDIYAADAPTAVKSVKMETFVSACGGEELTFEQIAILQENGIIE